MIKFVKIGLSVVVLAVAFRAGAYAATVTPKIFVNGNPVKSSSEPKNIDGTVYVPLRAISEALAVDIQWDNKSKTVYVDSDPKFDREPSNTSYVAKRNMAYRWIMGYDERDYDFVHELNTTDFTTDVYLDFPGGTGNMASLVDMRVIATSDSVLDDSLTVRIVQRVSSEDDYRVKVEIWKITFESNKVKSVKIVPGSVQYYDRYTVFPGLTFGIVDQK